jgi:hypothetical protein
MKKVLLPLLSLICSACFCLSVHAQQGVALPPPVKISEEQVDKAASLVPSKKFRHICYGDPLERVNTSYEVVAQEPRMGIKIVGYPLPQKIGRGIGVYSGKPEKQRLAYRIIFEEVKYDVTVDGNDMIKEISTDDAGFVTPEGIRVGDAQGKVVKVSGSKPVNMSMCFYDLKLKSGWHAIFGQADMKEDGSLAEDARVASFFKRD